MLDERCVKSRWPHIQHEVERGTNARDLVEPKFGQLAGFERRERGTADASLGGKLVEREPPPTAPFRDEPPDRSKIHASNIWDSFGKVQYMGLLLYWCLPKTPSAAPGSCFRGLPIMLPPPFFDWIQHLETITRNRGKTIADQRDRATAERGRDRYEVMRFRVRSGRTAHDRLPAHSGDRSHS